MKFLIFVALVSCVAPAYYECDWVPTIGCGGSIHVCELRSTVGFGVFDREEAEGLVIYHKCDWVPTLGCGGTIRVCELRATLGWGALNRKEAGITVQNLQVSRLLMSVMSLRGVVCKTLGTVAKSCFNPNYFHSI
ncbi:hypothetical protein GCK72_011775 [Caenorhabditis remanei]|uniref:Uncharacterized protein n=1 Tax=Caenorhabditis remanei TaxID=31234 RepID=A0A6A5H8Z5_CAERE|nr:hypothetical protein GCK72_011775 [Caenorhabditis remanei]KAF1763509.1 hypothetical protein GCK72_011775 [Caenorhabditis remanei]